MHRIRSCLTLLFLTLQLAFPSAALGAAGFGPANPDCLEPLGCFVLRLHPDGRRYVGDLVSFEIIAPPGADAGEWRAEVQVDAPAGPRFGPVDFAPFGIAGRAQATFQWVWDTRGLEPGLHKLTVSILPDGPRWTESVHLEETAALPEPEASARWQSAESACCLFYYLTGTAAERDLAALEALADAEAETAARQLQTEFDQAIPLVLVPRLLGHGGFVINDVYMSFLDRNYAGSDPAMILHHEMVHLLDQHLGGQLRPAILVEGLAVYLAGGHYKHEPLTARAATLLDLGWYLPLIPLSDHFYLSQHEIGYLEAGALVQYLVATWGWESFSDFYRTIRSHPSGSQAQALETALIEHYGLTMAALETRFLGFLARQRLIPDLREDVRQTVRFYNTVRRYQQEWDPSAYFLTVWLPPVDQMRAREVVADYMRHPDALENLAMETMLLAADARLRAGQYPEVQRFLAAVEAVLDARAEGRPDPFSADPLAADYYAIVKQVDARGFSAQVIQRAGETAVVRASQDGRTLVTMELVRRRQGWQVVAP